MFFVFCPMLLNNIFGVIKCKKNWGLGGILQWVVKVSCVSNWLRMLFYPDNAYNLIHRHHNILTLQTCNRALVPTSKLVMTIIPKDFSVNLLMLTHFKSKCNYIARVFQHWLRSLHTCFYDQCNVKCSNESIQILYQVNKKPLK